MKPTLFAVVLALLLGVSGAQYNCCDVIALEAEPGADGWVISPYMLSLYEITTTEHFCNRVEILSVLPNGTSVLLGKRDIENPHPREQPFTRSVGSVVLPEGTDTITAKARDSKYGFCGRSLNLTISGNAPAAISAPPAMPSPVTPTTATPVTVGPGTVPTLLPTPDVTVISTGKEAPFAPPTSGGPTGESAFPSMAPSDIPSWTPSNVPSEDPSIKGPGGPVGSKVPTLASSAAGYGFFAAALGAAVANFYLL